MTFEGYEFDASYRPADYESRIREGMPFGVAFYLDQKYVFDENDVFLPEMSKKNRLVIYCPQHGRFFEEDKKGFDEPRLRLSRGKRIADAGRMPV